MPQYVLTPGQILNAEQLAYYATRDMEYMLDSNRQYYNKILATPSLTDIINRGLLKTFSGGNMLKMIRANFSPGFSCADVDDPYLIYQMVLFAYTSYDRK